MVEWNVWFPIEAHTSIIVSSGGEELSLPYQQKHGICLMRNCESNSSVCMSKFPTAVSEALVYLSLEP